MINCTVEMWGLPREVCGLAQVEIQLKDNATLRDVVAALKKKAPALEGAVIRTGEDLLEETCVFNLDGRFLMEDETVHLQDGDCLRLLTLATGG